MVRPMGYTLSASGRSATWLCDLRCCSQLYRAHWRVLRGHAPCGRSLSRALKIDHRPVWGPEKAKGARGMIEGKRDEFANSGRNHCTTLVQRALGLGSADHGNCVCDFRQPRFPSHNEHAAATPRASGFFRHQECHHLSAGARRSFPTRHCWERNRSPRSRRTSRGAGLTAISPRSPRGNSAVPAGVSEPGVKVYSLCLCEVL
jgi:hypothetical protein